VDFARDRQGWPIQLQTARLLMTLAVRFPFPSRRLVAILPGMMATQFARRVMLALIVLDVLLRTKIFEPLGMNDTGFWVDTSKANRVTSIFTSGPDTRLIRQLVYQALVDCQK
jgi:hypothetical protein